MPFVATITAAVALSIVAGAVGGVAVTWGIWSLGLTLATHVGGYITLGAIVVAYTVVVVSTMRHIKAHVAKLAVGAVVGLLLALILGGVFSEIVHCHYDRWGCINL
jgi:hypothetical protein